MRSPPLRKIKDAGTTPHLDPLAFRRGEEIAYVFGDARTDTESVRFMDADGFFLSHHPMRGEDQGEGCF